MDESIFSPGEQLSARMRLEQQMTREATLGLDRFLTEVRNPRTNAPMSITVIEEMWLTAMEPVSQIVTEQDMNAVRSKINQMAIPSIVMDTREAVKQEALAQGWSQAKTKREMDSALQPDSRTSVWAPDTVTASLAEQGQTMNSLVKGLAVGLATGITMAILIRYAKEEMQWPKFRWVTRRDSKVRPTHAATDGQVRGPRQYFTVGGELLEGPGDPVGSPAETYNCRCVLVAVRR